MSGFRFPERTEVERDILSHTQEEPIQDFEPVISRGIVIDADWRADTRNSGWVDLYTETCADNHLHLRQVSSVSECEELLKLLQQGGTPVKAIILSGTLVVSGDQMPLLDILSKLGITILINTSTSIWTPNDPKAHEKLEALALTYGAVVFNKREFQAEEFETAIAKLSDQE